MIATLITRMRRISANLFDIRAFVIFHLFLGMLPVLVLVFTLNRNNVLDESLAALQGEYVIFGVPTNPWRDILPAFLITILVSLCAAGLGIFLIKYPIRNPFLEKLKPVLSFIIAATAAIAFEYSILQALISHLYFQDRLVLGVSAPVPRGVPTLLALFFVFAVYSFLLKSEKINW
jgi:hypothetical protein